MLKRILLLMILMIALAACTSADEAPPEVTETVNTAEVTPETVTITDADAEATEVTETTDNPYIYELDVAIDFPMAFGGTAQMGASSDWRLNDTSENDSVGRVVVFLDDGYLLELYVSNDPANDEDAPYDLLNSRNGTAEVTSLEYQGLTVYISETFLGNKLGFATLINDRQVVFIEISNTRQLDKELLIPTVLEMLATVEILSEE